jgi:calcineurin-like phosphoesterase family protein
MPNTFFIGDTHFGHANILTFKDNDGKPLRPFASVEEMDETMVDNWNRVVNNNDIVYHLGDVAMNRKHLAILERCKGTKKLIRGNHDTAPMRFYLRHFDQIHGAKVFSMPEDMGGGGFIATHIPVHEQSLGRNRVNIHGHLHCNHITKPKWLTYPEAYLENDPRYMNLCVEQIDYTPISISEIHKRILAL